MINMTLRGLGKATVDASQSDGPNIRKAKDMLIEMANGCVKYSENFIKTINEVPFAYREKQSTGMLAFALSQFTDTFQTECPVRKKLSCGKKEIFGWADFWAHYRNTDFFIELKQSYFYLHSNTVTQELSTEWQRVVEQVDSFSNENISGYCVSGSVVSLPFMVVPVYLRLKNDVSLKEGLKATPVEDAFHKIKSELNPAPTWCYLWKLKEELVEQTSWDNDNGTGWYLPALIFLAKIYTLEI